MHEDSQPIFPVPRFETWRKLALGACLLAMFWPIVKGIVIWAGSGSLLAYDNPYPSLWVAAFVFGALVGRMDAIYVAAIGITAAIVVSVGLHESGSGTPPDELLAFYGERADLAALLVNLAVPWIWIAVFVGLGAVVSGRLRLLLGLRG